MVKMIRSLVLGSLASVLHLQLDNLTRLAYVRTHYYAFINRSV